MTFSVCRNLFAGVALVLAGCCPDPSISSDASVSDDGGAQDARPDILPSPDSSSTCADVTIQTTIVEPTVTLVIDQSGSMNTDLVDGLSRWDAVHAALTGPEGVVTELESKVRFGLSLYSDEDGGTAACPLVTSVDAMLRNRSMIDQVYRDSEPLGETPTGDALQVIQESIGLSPDDTNPHIFVLATDGGPDRCGEPDGHDDVSRRLSVEAVEAAFDLGIRTFVIALGEETVAEEHLQDLANAGVGMEGAEYFEATDPAGLAAVLRGVVSSELTCTLELEGRIDPAFACSGQVILDGTPLECESPNGWRTVDETHIELLGDACVRLQTEEVLLSATFPCEALI